MSDESSPLRAARALIAKLRERGGSLSQTDAHQAVRMAYGGQETSMRTWRAARAALNALASGRGQVSPEWVSRVIARSMADDSPRDDYPAELYGSDQHQGPSQWATPERRQQLRSDAPATHSETQAPTTTPAPSPAKGGG